MTLSLDLSYLTVYCDHGGTTGKMNDTISENTRLWLASFQSPVLRRALYVWMDWFKLLHRKELQEATAFAVVPAPLEDTLNEYIVTTAPEGFREPKKST